MALDTTMKGALTYGRQTSVTFDVPQTFPQEPAFALSRQGKSIQPTAISNTMRLKSGMWVLKPVNDQDVNSELQSNQQYILGAGDLTLSTFMFTVNRARALSELSGVGVSGDVVSTGDPWLRRRVPSGSSWNNPVGTTPGVYGSPNYPIDRHARSTNLYPANQGYLIKLLFVGATLVKPDYMFGFEFGGELVGTGPSQGYGRFYLQLTGDGRAYLYERIAGAWVEVGAWRYGNPMDAPGMNLFIRIIPHAPRFLQIDTFNTPDMQNQYGNMAVVAVETIKQSTGNFSSFSNYTHTTANRPAAGLSAAGLSPSITGPGPVGVDFRRDLGCFVQVSRLAYPASGTITDGAFALPRGVTSGHATRAHVTGYNWKDGGADQPPKTGIAVTLQTAAGGALTTTEETMAWNGANYRLPGWIAPGGENLLRAVVTLTNTEPIGQKWHTPSFLGYEVQRNGHGATHNITAKTGGRVTSMSITGPTTVPDTETAGFTIEDEKNELAFLRSRALATVRIETTWDPADQTKKVVLFEGATGRVTAKRRGKFGSTYPSAEWRELDVEAMGMWYRFTDRFYLTRQNFNIDVNSPPIPAGEPGAGTFQAWKVTDVIRKTLLDEGIPDSQLDIPDDPMRLFISPHGGESNYSVPPGTLKWPFITKLARDYLNAFIIWDGNAGTEGKWRMMRPPTGSETILWNFVNGADAGGVTGKLAHLGVSYGTTHSVILRDPFEFHSYVIPPEGNLLRVTGGTSAEGKLLMRQLENATSWDTPARTTANQNDLDYLGRCVPVEYVDVTLGTGMSTPVGQFQVDFIARRIFQIACRGRKWFSFVADMPLINAAALEPSQYTTRTRRPLRTGDTISIDGERCFLHTINPIWENDTCQHAYYEAELYRPNLAWK